MKILKIYPQRDQPKRYNYHINYGVWDDIPGDSAILEKFNSNLNNYDVIFIPMFSRWQRHLSNRWRGHYNLLNKIKEHKIKTILFDNDSCYRSFNDKFYIGFDYIFYRDLDKNREQPKNINSSRLLWSVDTNLYLPKYGGRDILFNCSVSSSYTLRKKIAKVIKKTNHNGSKYIEELQNSGAAIHTNSPIQPMVRAKILEFASCGTQIISNKSDYMELYFPHELIIYFNTIDELKNIIENFKSNIEIQKELRNIVETKHDNKIRAKEILNKIKEII